MEFCLVKAHYDNELHSIFFAREGPLARYNVNFLFSYISISLGYCVGR